MISLMDGMVRIGVSCKIQEFICITWNMADRIMMIRLVISSKVVLQC